VQGIILISCIYSIAVIERVETYKCDQSTKSIPLTSR